VVPFVRNRVESRYRQGNAEMRHPIAPSGLRDWGRLRDLARQETLGASSHNTQPWKFRLAERSIAIRPVLGPPAAPPNLGARPRAGGDAAVDGSSRQPGQDRGRRHERILPAAFVTDATAFEETVDAPPDGCVQTIHLLLRWRRHRMELQTAGPVLSANTPSRTRACVCRLPLSAAPNR
jgi:hypothetical protein